MVTYFFVNKHPPRLFHVFMCRSAFFSLADLISDAAIIVANRAQSEGVMVVLGVALGAQALTSKIFGEPSYRVLGAACGLNPLMYAYRANANLYRPLESIADAHKMKVIERAAGYTSGVEVTSLGL